jgi:ABC-2 type transport system permease protein
MLLRQVKAEWIKARSLRSTWFLCGIALLAMIAQVVSAVLSYKHEPEHVQTLNALSGSTFTLIVVTMLGVFLAATEYSSKAIITTYTVTAHRARVVIAKVIVAAGFAAVIGIISVPLARLVAAIMFGVGVDGGWDAGIGTAVHYGYGAVVAYAGFAAIGVVVGTLSRSIGIGIGAVFVVIFFLDALLGSVSFYSEYALNSTATVLLNPDGATGKLPAFGGSVALLVLYSAVLAWVAVEIERRRDVA